MSTSHDDEVTQPTLEALADALDQLREESEAHRRDSQAEITALKAEIARLQPSPGVHSTPPHPPLADEDDDKQSILSRRGALLALGGVAAGGAGLALGSAVMGASPAAAATGDPVILGQANTCDGTTQINTSAGSGLNVSTTDSAPGLYARESSSGGSIGVIAQSVNGYGLIAEGGLAPILISTSTTVGPPSSGQHQPGEIYVDSNGAFWGCVASGTPGTWIKDSPFVPLGPARAYDSRTSDGPLGNGTRTVSLTASGFPAGASVALMNVTVVDTVGVGYLTLFAHGASKPNTANVNWYAASQILNNSANVSGRFDRGNRRLLFHLGQHTVHRRRLRVLLLEGFSNSGWAAGSGGREDACDPRYANSRTP